MNRGSVNRLKPEPLNPLPAFAVPGRSVKGAYPFRTAATSFVYPADYLPNVRRLAPYFDEIELLFYEAQGLPPRAVITELAAIRAAEAVGFNVHLPLDVSISDREPLRRAQAVDALCRACEHAAPLHPSTFTLHIPGPGPAGWEAWHERVRPGVARLAAAVADPARISVETLDYPLEQADDLLAEYGLSVCMDVGHLVLGGRDLAAFAARFAGRIAVIHLHAAGETGDDHLPPDRLPAFAAAQVCRLLSAYRGLVALEVFSIGRLAASVEWLAAHVGGRPI